MRIHCDHCGAECSAEEALVVRLDDEVLYFCSEHCLEEADYHETMTDPGQGEDASAPDVR